MFFALSFHRIRNFSFSWARAREAKAGELIGFLPISSKSYCPDERESVKLPFSPMNAAVEFYSKSTPADWKFQAKSAIIIKHLFVNFYPHAAFVILLPGV